MKRIGVIISPGWGSGLDWTSRMREDSELVSMVMSKADNVKIHERAMEKYEDEDCFMSSYNPQEFSIAWLERGTPYMIYEYDGSERIITPDNFTYIAGE